MTDDAYPNPEEYAEEPRNTHQSRSMLDAWLGEAYGCSESDFPKGPMCDCRRDMKTAKQDRSGFAEGRVSRW